MLLKESIQKTKNLFRRTLQTLRSFCFRRYQKFPIRLLSKPFSCSGGRTERHHTDQFYSDFYGGWDFDVQNMRSGTNAFVPSKKPMEEEASCSGGSTQCLKQILVGDIKENGGKEKKKITASSCPVDAEAKCDQNKQQGSYALAKKMKELEMMYVGDMEHELDVEEALHYYSRLKSPVYLDIVDNFFMDIYKDFSAPQASVCINNSKRRFGSIRL